MNHPHDEVIRAWLDGKVIQFRRTKDAEWTTVEEDNFDRVGFYHHYHYRIKPTDPLAELKEAYAQGKRVQAWGGTSGRWETLYYPMWNLRVDQYRIAPEPDPYVELYRQYRSGLEIETLVDNKWHRLGNAPEFNLPVGAYRVYDRYRALKEAHAAGKQIEIDSGYGRWVPATVTLAWNMPPERYRIKPDHKVVQYRINRYERDDIWYIEKYGVPNIEITWDAVKDELVSIRKLAP